MKVVITSRQTIKPSFPTPNHRRNFSLSLLDQLSPSFYGLIVFFYAATPSTHQPDGAYCRHKSSKRSYILRSSLSKALTHFYPMARRLKDAASIDCNDEGAYFVEARIDCQLSNFLEQPDMEALNRLLPTTDPETSEAASGRILLVQQTTFSCGGTALSICLLHKNTDVSSLVTFLQSWTAITRDSGKASSPEFIGASLVPPGDLSFLPAVNIPSGNFITKRFVFEPSTIARLKAKAAGLFVPSRVEVVLALILKCSVAASRAKSGSAKPVVLFQAVNLRKRMVPPLPDFVPSHVIGLSEHRIAVSLTVPYLKARTVLLSFLRLINVLIFMVCIFKTIPVLSLVPMLVFCSSLSPVFARKSPSGEVYEGIFFGHRFMSQF